jgi:hypothetical protein
VHYERDVRRQKVGLELVFSRHFGWLLMDEKIYGRSVM